MTSNNKNLILNIMAAGVMVYAVLLLFNIFYNAFDTAAYPNEYREAANVYMTKSIVEGKNIYSLDVLESEEPGLIYLYGPLESIIAAIFVLLFRADMVLVHYMIAFIAMIIGAGMMARMVREHTSTYLPAAMAFLFTIYCNWRYGYIYAAPDALGLFLLILFLFVLTRKDTNVAKPYIGAVVAILSFFTKQYFAVIALTGFLYFLFLKKKDLIRYTLSGIIISAIAFVVINIRYPLYWTYNLYFLKGPGAGLPSGDVAGTAHNISQVKYIVALFFVLFLAAFLHIIIILYRIIRKEINISISLKDENIPFIRVSGDEHFCFEILFYIQMLVAAAILYYIGNNSGAFISYYLQLFVPALIVVGVVSADNISIDEKYLSNSLKFYIIITLNVLMCVYTIMRAEPRLIVTKMADIDRAYWNSLYECIAEYEHDEVYYNPLGVYPVIETDKYIYNTGMPFVISERFLDKYNESKFSQKLFPYAGRVMQQHLQYREKVRKKVLDGDYEMIMYMDDMDTLFSRHDMAGRYERIMEMPMKAGSWSWDMMIYLRKGDDTLDDIVEIVNEIDY